MQQDNGSVWLVENDALVAAAPKVLSRSRGLLLTEPFDTRDGIVLGSVPGAREGAKVTIAGTSR